MFLIVNTILVSNCVVLTKSEIVVPKRKNYLKSSVDTAVEDSILKNNLNSDLDFLLSLQSNDEDSDALNDDYNLGQANLDAIEQFPLDIFLNKRNRAIRMPYSCDCEVTVSIVT